jgi:hypothetical protein
MMGYSTTVGLAQNLVRGATWTMHIMALKKMKIRRREDRASF